MRAAASRPAPPERLRHSFHEARCALEATAFANGARPEVASLRATSAPSPCCSRCRTTRRCASTATASSARSRMATRDYGGELLRSLEAFIEQNGQWERAARELYCHRHTLRYRIAHRGADRARPLSRAHDRIEFWLALRARELVK